MGRMHILAVAAALLVVDALAQSDSAYQGWMKSNPANAGALNKNITGRDFFRSPTVASSIRQTYARLPLRFEASLDGANVGRQFFSRGSGSSLLLAPTDATLRSINGGSLVRIRFLGANPSSNAIGLDQLPGKSNYFIGKDSSKWRTNVPNYTHVKFNNIYPGVDLVYYGNQENLEYDLVVGAGMDFGRIRLAFDGIHKLSLNAAGDLVLETPGGRVLQHKPVVYQELAGHRRLVDGSYRLAKNREVTFSLGEYDKTKPLVIDPVLAYSTNAIGGDFVAMDSQGNTYVTGCDPPLLSTPVSPGAFQVVRPGGYADAFVAKLDPSGTSLIYSTYLGGSGYECPLALAVDSGGSAYVSGYTDSSDFPVTSGALQTANGNGFVTKLDPTGSTLVYSAIVRPGVALAIDSAGNGYIAGKDSVQKLNSDGSALVYSRGLGGIAEQAVIAVDGGGNAYVAGVWGQGRPIPTTPGAFDNGGHTFVTKISADGAQVLYSAILGGTLSGIGPLLVAELEGVNGLAVDGIGNVYLTGFTSAGDFPTTAGAPWPPNSDLGPSVSGNTTTYFYSLFVTKLNSSGSELVYSSVLGFGSGNGVAVDTQGNLWVAGYTHAINFPTTPDAAQLTFAAGTCGSGSFEHSCSTGFLFELTADGTSLAYSTYIGGFSSLATGVAVDCAGNVSVTGHAGLDYFPTSGALPSTPGARDNLYVAKFVTSRAACAPDPWKQVITQMKAAAGTNSLNFWQWAWFWQRSPAFSGAPAGFGVLESIDATLGMIDRIIAVGGGDGFQIISAEQWLMYYRQVAVQSRP